MLPIPNLINNVYKKLTVTIRVKTKYILGLYKEAENFIKSKILTIKNNFFSSL